MELQVDFHSPRKAKGNVDYVEKGKAKPFVALIGASSIVHGVSE